jgi:tetratricopeptide (TPR) repeat protein
MPKLPSSASNESMLAFGRTDVLQQRATRLYLTGQHDEAIRLFQQVLSIDPTNAEAAGYLGMAYAEEKQPVLAVQQFDNALRIDPARPLIWLFRGIALADIGRLTDALGSFDRAIALRPNYEEAHVNRAATLYRLGRFSEARVVAEGLVRRLPDDPGLASGHGMTLQWTGQPYDALTEYSRAIALNPNDAGVHANKGMLLIYLGNLPEGFREYEWRWRQGPNLADRDHITPLWLGETGINDKTILLYHEQGFGDSLQFCRYATLAARAGARVIIEVPGPLSELMTTVPGVSRVVTSDDPLPDHDLRCPMVSLPLAFGTTLDTIPSEIPYLRPASAAVDLWRNRLLAVPGLRVGLVWAGSSRFGSAELMATDQRRSLPLSALAPLASVAGCSFVSIQVGSPAEQAKSPPAGMILHDLTSQLRDFADTAGLIENLDLVISADTAVVHLAGAMGKPVWVLNRFDSCWRWFQDRDDSPWYPTLRLFRQTAPGNWIDVASRVAAELQSFVAAQAEAGSAIASDHLNATAAVDGKT